MTYKQGRFYDNLGNPVALEHGNKDQIALINRAEALRAGVVPECSQEYRMMNMVSLKYHASEP